ncbi:MAG: polyphosphate glucokinase [Frankiales bacterium]|jgi:polyphosphate glucokinase|nr:polyphosphate glucokinase [Frankiales bacterium]
MATTSNGRSTNGRGAAKRSTSRKTLAIDVGGSGLKAIVLDGAGKPISDRVRVPTPYPLPPDRLVNELVDIVASLPSYDRVSVGFPGVVRDGRVLTAPNLSRESGPDSPVDKTIAALWTGFPLADALSDKLGKPVRIANDADLQAAAVVSGKGIEIVLTLGTGLGASSYRDGRLALHLEMGHHPFRDGKTYEDLIGDVGRRKLGKKKWSKTVAEAVKTIENLIVPDQIYIGGGNAKKLDVDLGPKVSIIDNTAGLLGGIKLWRRGGLEGAPTSRAT